MRLKRTIVLLREEVVEALRAVTLRHCWGVLDRRNRGGLCVTDPMAGAFFSGRCGILAHSAAVRAPREGQQVEMGPVCVRHNHLAAKRERNRSKATGLATPGLTGRAQSMRGTPHGAVKPVYQRTIPSGTAPAHSGLLRLPTRATTSWSGVGAAAATDSALSRPTERRGPSAGLPRRRIADT